MLIEFGDYCININIIYDYRGCIEVRILPKPNISSNQYGYISGNGNMNQSCLNIPQIPNPSSYIQPPVINNTTQYSNNFTRNTFLQPPVTLNNNNISRSTITPPGVSSATINRNNLTPPNSNYYSSHQPSSPIPYNSVLPNTQSYQPPLPLGSSYIKPPPSPPPINQSYIQPPSQQPINQSYNQQQGYVQPPSNDYMDQSYNQQPPPPQQPINQSYNQQSPQQQPINQSYIQPPPEQQQGYNQPPSNDYMNQSYIPPPLEHSYLNSQPYEAPVADISSLPTDFTSKPNGDFTLTDHIVKNEYHTYVLYDPPLGSGSYATAYLVSCESFTLVMKKMNTKKYQDNVKKMLQDEMKILSELPEHPNVIQYMDGFQQGDYYYLVMNYCRDGDLLEIIQKHKEDDVPIPENEILNYITDIANGILFIHKQNIVHRDLKPGNIFMDRGKCIIGDFGIAKMINNDSVACSTFIGTPSYMAPEMFKEEKYDSCVDIWAFGCIIIELCTLNLPFSGSNIMIIMQEIEKANIPELKGYSSFLDGLVHKCIVYDPQSRFTSQQIVDYLHSTH